MCVYQQVKIVSFTSRIVLTFASVNTEFSEPYKFDIDLFNIDF